VEAERRRQRHHERQIFEAQQRRLARSRIETLLTQIEQMEKTRSQEIQKEVCLKKPKWCSNRKNKISFNTYCLKLGPESFKAR